MYRMHLHFVAAMVVLGWFNVSTQGVADETRIRDLPIPEGATEITYVKRRGDVRFGMNSDFKTVGNFYAKTLAEQQWTKSGKDNLQSSFWVQTFSKGNASVEVRVADRQGGSEVRLTPQGMMWQEDDQPTAKDIPLAADAKEIEYDDFFESIEFKSSSNVKTVVESLTQELEKKKWSKAATEFDTDNFVRMKFTQQSSSLDIDVRADDSGCEVAIRTKGMQWDGMKAEIARAKQMAEKVAEHVAESTPAKLKTPNKVAVLPERKDKPKQGIDRLPSLPNEGTVVMDGKTHKLPQLIAYEVFEHDHWSTKIVATQKAIKQETLLARLKQTGTDTDENDTPPSFPQPHLLIVLDEDDQPWRLSLLADGTPGGGTGSELKGTALVEEGRARGTVALKEPDSFFDKVYTAEISFDLPVLTRASTAAKRLVNAPKLANTGKLLIDNKTYKLANVVSYVTERLDEPVTTVVLSEKPLNMAKLNAALGKKAADDYFEFTPQVKLTIDADDNVTSVSLWADNVSISGNSSLDGDVVIEDGRARGVAKLSEPGEFYNFELSFDVDVLGTRPAAPSKPTDGLQADSHDGLPVPVGYKGMQSEGSRFRSQATTTVAAELGAVVAFYRAELPSENWGAWKENVAEAKVAKQSAELTFNTSTGSLIVQLKADGGETAITLVSRNAKAAEAAGLLPSAGKARLVIGNISTNAAVININKQEYNVAAGVGAEDPKTGINWEVAPGNFSLEIKPVGEPVQSEKLKIGAGEIWGVIIGPSGGFIAMQLY